MTDSVATTPDVLNKQVDDPIVASKYRPKAGKKKEDPKSKESTGKDQIIINPPDLEVKEEALDEIKLETRFKRAMNLRRMRAKLKQFKSRSKTRYASKQSLHRKALRYARLALRQRIAGAKGQKYSSLAPANKKAVDKQLLHHTKQVKSVSRQISSRVSSAELSRLVAARSGKPRSGTKSFFKGRVQVQASFAPDEVLLKKSVYSGIPLEVLREVYARGIASWNDQSQLTAEQTAFNRVNSFIGKGKTYHADDADLTEAALDYSQQSRILQLIKAGMLDSNEKQRYLTILNKMRVISDIDKLQLSDKNFLVKLYDKLMGLVVGDNQLFNRTLTMLRGQ